MLEYKINNLSLDVYYQREYSTLYENGGDYFEFLYEEECKFVRFSSLRRRISEVAGVKLDEELYDLETPYGYGGPLTNSNDEHFLKRAFFEYKKHCRDKLIVCEFIRFHPFNEMVKNKCLFDMFIQERQIVLVDLLKSTEERQKAYSKTTRNIVKKAKKFLTVEVDNTPLPDFLKMYYQTMQKNIASDFFYFDDAYFKKLQEIDGAFLLATKKNNEYASIGFFLCGKELAHYHLSANNQELSKENGNYLLLDAAFEHAKANGCKYMLLGGGRTSSPDDSLFKFKSKFSPSLLPFYIAGLDFWPEKRIQLNQFWEKENIGCVKPKLFQLYRA